jgi:hypothetical protein
VLVYLQAASHCALVVFAQVISLHVCVHVFVLRSQRYPCGCAGGSGFGGVGTFEHAALSDSLVQPCSLPSLSAHSSQASVAFCASHISRRCAVHSAGVGGFGGAGRSPSQYEISSRLVQLAFSVSAVVKQRSEDGQNDEARVPLSDSGVAGALTTLLFRALVAQQLRFGRTVGLEQLLALV